MADYVDTKVSNLVINNLTQEKYDELLASGQINPDELYCTPDNIEELLETKQDKATAVKYSDTDFIAHLAMPANRYTDLTLGASGSQYTAPADGWFHIIKTGNASQYLSINVGGYPYSINGFAPNYNGAQVKLLCPVSKGATVSITYDLSGETNYFRFVYANGAK